MADQRIWVQRHVIHMDDPKITEFGVNDRLGRHIGTRVRTYVVEYSPAPEDAKSGYSLPAGGFGTYFCFTTQATRDAGGHQASHESKFFTDATVRDAAVAKHIEAAQKRALDPKARTKA